MSVTAKRDDVFIPPVLVTVRGWAGQPLPQIHCGLICGLTSLRMPRQVLRPANDQ